MACACSAGKKKYTVLYSSGKTYKVYSTKVEAEAAAKRVGGTVKVS
jgi:hypothetical protein